MSFQGLPSDGNMSRVDSWQWNLHIYGFTGLWVAHGFYVFVTCVNLRAHALAVRDCRKICAVHGFFTLLRAMYLLVDPYNRYERIPPPLNDVFLMIVQPCLLVSFQLQYFAYFRIAKINSQTKAFCKDFVHYSIWLSCLVLMTLLEVLYRLYKTTIASPYFIVRLSYSFWIILAMFWFIYGAISVLRSIKNGRKYTLELHQSLRCDLGGSNKVVEIPKIRITDENERSYSFKSENSLNSEQGASPDNGLPSDQCADLEVSLRKKRCSKKRRKKPSSSALLRHIFYMNLPSCILLLIGSALNLYQTLGASTSSVPELANTNDAFSVVER